MADWNEMEAQYLAGGVSYRMLAEKYGVDVSTVKRRGKKGNWVGKREEYGEGVRAELLEQDRAARVDRFARLNTVADGLLLRVEELGSGADITPAALKTLTEALKNIRDAQMLRGRLDAAEQEMRIEKLRKEMSKGEHEGQLIKVVLEGTEAFCN